MVTGVQTCALPISGKWRVNGSVQNFDEFGKAFGCTKGKPMYPANSCRVW
jgi:putative endopeptidase